MKVLDKTRNKRIALSTAIKKKGLLKNLNKFELPPNQLVIRKKGKYEFINIKEAKSKYNKGEIKLHNLFGSFDFTSNKGYITKDKVGKRIGKSYKQRYTNTIIKYQLTKADRLNPQIVWKFFKDNNISGTGKFIMESNNQVLTETDINIDQYPSLNKWYKNVGMFIGMIDSDTFEWNTVNKRQGVNINLFRRIGGLQGGFDLTTEDTNAEKKEYKKLWNKTIVKFYFVPDTTVNAKKITQVFRENTTNSCFFDVIEKYLNDKIANVGKKSLKNYTTKLNKLKKVKQNYPNGMPQTDIKKICDLMMINIQIYDILGNLINEYRCDGIPRTTIKFMNSRLNHTDCFIDYRNNIIETTEMNTLVEKIKELQKTRKPFYYVGTLHEPRMVMCGEGTYQYKSEQNEIINQFNKEQGFYNFSIDVLNDSEKYNYIHNAVNYNSHCKFSKLDEQPLGSLKFNGNIIEPDLKKAYSQYKNCKYYLGFCNNLTPVLKLKDWNVEKCKKYLGYYTCKILKIKNDNVKKILSELGIDERKIYTLSSPEILFFNNHGVEFKFICGSYSFTPLHFDLPEKFFTKFEGKSTYAIWAGKLNSVNLHTDYRFFGEVELAETLAQQYENVSINKWFNTRFHDDNSWEKIDADIDEDEVVECKIRFEKPNVSYLGHIGGFITAYTRINVLEELFTIPFENIYGFKLDGFVIDKTGVDNWERFDKGLWKLKKVKVNFNWDDEIFEREYKEDIVCREYPDIFKKRITLLSGAGGTGKSHSVLENCKDTLFVSLMWRLNTEKMKEYNVKGISFHQLIGENCESYLLRNKVPSKILIDELTMIDSKKIKEIVKKCPYTQFFLAGDIDRLGNHYQLSFKDVNVFNPKDLKNKIDIVEFRKNYRCKDPKLLNKLNKLRQFMKESKFDKDIITEWVKSVFKERIIKFNKNGYDYKKDWILVSVINGDNSQVKYYTELCDGKKYRCVKHNKTDIYKKLSGEKAYLNGEIEIDLIEPTKKWVKQDAFTIHSFQGITIKKGNKMFIDLNRLFDARQLYTALSRVEYLDQIYLIE